ncbi:MAG: hypothetical protein RL702_310 [Pseudomonadota bacterium]|jgi:hypothetical protein|nr:DUF1489 domain-containing protein [Novosphingobium sp.]HPB21306.1 DUF1489 domain-containing protein [Novosphingobium sp.]HQN54901.1 DUF1489 domain-containing protein [Novosphingobium sp.]
MPLHLTKVAYGAQSLDEMRGWFSARGDIAYLTTRYLPKRHDEIVPPDGSPGGSLFWIFKHQLVMRSPILRFEEAEGGRTNIVIASRLIEVHPQPKRAHQGWRYLEAENAPADLVAGESAGDALPGNIAAELARLGLV